MIRQHLEKSNKSKGNNNFIALTWFIITLVIIYAIINNYNVFTNEIKYFSWE